MPSGISPFAPVAQEASPELGVRLLTHVATFEKFSDTHGEGRPL
jgi:hypothetical protein